MNIKDFLIDNYIWIIVIILITIITIIGFLADKKKGSNKDKVTPQINPNTNNNQINNNMGTIQYQSPVDSMTNQMDNNMGLNYNSNQNNNVPQPVNQINNMQPNQNLVNTNNTNPMELQQFQSTIPTDVNQINQPQPIQNIQVTSPQEPIYQPLSEQKPVIPPQPIPNFSNMQLNNNQSSTDNMINNSLINMMPGTMPVQNQSTPEVAMPTQMIQPQEQTPNLVSETNYNLPPSAPQQNENNNYGYTQNFNQNNTTIPQPINAQPIMQDSFNNQQMQPQPNSNIQMPQQKQQNQQPQMANSPINFVYGPQNNNQNM